MKATFNLRGKYEKWKIFIHLNEWNKTKPFVTCLLSVPTIPFLDPTEIYYLGSLSSPMLIPQSLAVHNVRIYWSSSSLCTFQLFNSPIPGTQSTEVQLNRDEQWDQKCHHTELYSIYQDFLWLMLAWQPHWTLI